MIAVREFFGVVLLPIWSCSTMDSIRVSEALDSSSILDGTTTFNDILRLSWSNLNLHSWMFVKIC